MPDPPFLRISAAQVHKLDFAYGPTQKARAKAFEFLHRVSRKAAQIRIHGFLTGRTRQPNAMAELEHCGFGGGFGGVNDPHAGRHRPFNQRPQQRVMRAAKNQRVRVRPSAAASAFSSLR